MVAQTPATSATSLRALNRLITPTQEAKRTAIARPRELPKGIDSGVDQLVGIYRRRGCVLTELLREAERIDALSLVYHPLSDRRLREKLDEFRAEFRRRDREDPNRVRHAFAAIREAAERRVGLRPFLVQLAGAAALHRGYLAEMATGEGKTLTAGVAAILFGWTRLPTHVITVNDYLAQRDAEWMRPLYAFCGVTVGSITGAMEPPDRRAAYERDVSYCTGKEVVADFLRDRLRLGRFQNAARRQIRFLFQPLAADRIGLVMRGIHTAIVDEADSVMIDEAVTPVIISSSHENDALREACRIAAGIADQLERGVDYETNHRYREVELHDRGEKRLETLCAGLPGLWRGPSRRLELVKQALTAKELFHEGKQYVIQEGKVVIVDEFTGRIMPQRTWREGLHQAIEAKEGIEVTDPSETLARVSFQRFYRFYRKLSGMTGTALEAATEFWHIYRLPVVSIPTNRPCIRDQRPDRIYADQDAKWAAAVEEIQRIHAEGRPILVGTRSVTASETLSERLRALGLEHRVLNAVRHREEAQIVAEAGQHGHITIATNMAGRGTDILLGRGVVELGGLHVLATERHESRRIDRQLFGRAARQGDPGSAQALVGIDDELVRRFAPNPMRRQLDATMAANPAFGVRMAAGVFGYAQRAAQRLAVRQRRNVLKTDTWMEESLAFAGEEHE